MAEKSRSKLFVWDDWVRYIECRKSVILCNYFYARYQTERDLSLSVDSYLHHALKQRSLEKITKKRCKGIGSIERQRILADVVKKFPKHKKMKTRHYFLPSLSPFVSNLNVILSRWYSHGYIGDSAPPIEILAFDHTKTSVDFLVDPNKVIQFAQNQGIDVIVKKIPICLEYILPKKVCQIGVFRSVYVLKQDPCCALVDVDECKSNDSQQLLSDVAPTLLSKQETTKHDNMEKSNYSIDVDNVLIEPKKKQINKSEKGNIITSLNDSDTPQDLQYHKNSKQQTSKNKEELSSARIHHDETSSKSNTLTLHMPLSDYRVLKMSRYEVSNTFARNVEPDFSLSFDWLLKECSNILQTKVFEFYRAFREIEELCFGNIDVKELIISSRGPSTNPQRNKFG